jgi:hypothetical protein
MKTLALVFLVANTIVNGFLSQHHVQHHDVLNRQHHSSFHHQHHQHVHQHRVHHVHQSTTTQQDDITAMPSVEPQVLATGYSQAMELTTALEEAMAMALEALPVISSSQQQQQTDDARIDLAIVSVSSLYDGNSKPSDVVPTILQAASSYGQGIQHLIGGTSGGFVSSLANLNEEMAAPEGYYPMMTPVVGDDDEDASSDDENDDDGEEQNTFKACRPIEREGVPGVTVTLAILPDVNVQVSNSCFHVSTGTDDGSGNLLNNMAQFSLCRFILSLVLPLSLLDLSCNGRGCTR